MSIFEAFFWLEPIKSTSKTVGNSSKVLWNYPDDVSKVVEEFKDIPEYCFPDLHRVGLEKAQSSKSEHYTFTLTDSNGQRLYGICMRGLFRGANRRYDVKRRVRHCLCIVTRFPFFKFFKCLLLELHAIAMLEEKPGCCRQFIDLVFRKCDANSINKTQRILIESSSIVAMYYSFSVVCPKISTAGGGMFSKEVSVLPLFDVLGVERFFKLLAAVLSEKRIVFVAEETEVLCNFVLAAANMLHPFKWPHIFIPLLPAKLLSFLKNQTPYMIGVRKYLASELRRDSLDGTVVVDCDTGDVKLYGSVNVKDIIGDAASASKQASEKLDQIKTKMSGMASLFMGKSSSTVGDSPQDIGPKDLMVVVLNDLNKHVVATKPGSYSISSLLGSGGYNRSVEEAKIQWSIDAEKGLRDTMALFFVYLFADLDDFIHSLPSNLSGNEGNAGGFGAVRSDGSRGRMTGIGSDSAGGEVRPFPSDDPRSHIDIKAFLNKRNTMGDSRHIISFLVEFIASQIFQKYCAELLVKKANHAARAQEISKRRSLASNVSSSFSSPGGSVSGARGGVNSLPTSLSSSSLGAGLDENEDNLFEAACADFLQRNLPLTIANAKSCVAAGNAALSSGSVGGAGGGNFHTPTIQLTSGSTPLAQYEAEIDKDHEYYTSTIGFSGSTHADTPANKESWKRASVAEPLTKRILEEAENGDTFINIMRSIHFRLQGCLAAGCRGSSGIAGLRALLLLRSLLLEGPECVLSHGLDFLSVVRGILHLATNNQTSMQQAALDYMSLGAFMDPTWHAKIVLDLMIDHKKLIVQRKVVKELKRCGFPYITGPTSNYQTGDLKPAQFTKVDVFFSAPAIGGAGAFGQQKVFPKFESLHRSLNKELNLPSIAAEGLRLTTPELAVGAVEDRLNGGDDDDVVEREPPSPIMSYTAAKAAAAAEQQAAASQPSGRRPTHASAPSSSGAYGAASSSAHSTPSRGAPAPTKPAKPVVRERFIYSDDDDTSSSAPAPAGSVAPFAASQPRPAAPAPAATTNARTQSPFRASAPAATETPFAPSASATATKAPTGHHHPPLPPPANHQKPKPAPMVDLLNQEDDFAPSTGTSSIIASTSALSFSSDPFAPSVPASAAKVAPSASSSDPFGADPFAPSPSVAVKANVFDDFAPSAPVGATTATPFDADPFAPSPSSFAPSRPISTSSSVSAFGADPFAPSPASWGGASTTHDAFAPTVSSGNLAAAGGFDGFTPTVASNGSNGNLSTLGGQNGSFIRAQPPQGFNSLGQSQAPADPFDFLNPIKK